MNTISTSGGFQTRQMNFFRGSTPLKLIHFRLENQTAAIITAPTDPLVKVSIESSSPPAELQSQASVPGEAQAPEPQELTEDIISSHSADEAIVQLTPSAYPTVLTCQLQNLPFRSL